MKEKLIAGYLRWKLSCLEAWENFREEEKGASDIVAILLVIVILVAVAGIFKDQLEGFVEAVFEKLTNSIEGLSS